MFLQNVFATPAAAARWQGCQLAVFASPTVGMLITHSRVAFRLATG